MKPSLQALIMQLICSAALCFSIYEDADKAVSITLVCITMFFHGVNLICQSIEREGD